MGSRGRNRYRAPAAQRQAGVRVALVPYGAFSHCHERAAGRPPRLGAPGFLLIPRLPATVGRLSQVGRRRRGGARRLQDCPVCESIEPPYTWLVTVATPPPTAGLAIAARAAGRSHRSNEDNSIVPHSPQSPCRPASTMRPVVSRQTTLRRRASESLQRPHYTVSRRQVKDNQQGSRGSSRIRICPPDRHIGDPVTDERSHRTPWRSDAPDSGTPIRSRSDRCHRGYAGRTPRPSPAARLVSRAAAGHWEPVRESARGCDAAILAASKERGGGDATESIVDDERHS